MYYIPISEANGDVIIELYGKRVICMVNGNKIHCAVQKRKEVGYYIAVGKATREKIKADYKDPLQIEVRKDDSKYQMEVPEELEEVLETDLEAKAHFEALTPGKQRSIIHHIGKAKHSNTRINRALKLAENLKMGLTDLKELMR